MMRFITRFRKPFHYGEKGFTLIELLIVMVIVGVLGALVALNVGGFLGAGEVQAANTEAHNVRVAVIAYMTVTERAAWSGSVGPDEGDGNYCSTFLDGGEAVLKADYAIDTTKACIITNAIAVDAVEGGWSDAIEWNATPDCAWVKKASE